MKEIDVSAPSVQPGLQEKRPSCTKFSLQHAFTKAEEVDDSSGSFGEFVGALLLASIRDQQRAGMPVIEVVRKMRRWVERDEYGFCTQLEEEAANVLSAEGQREFERTPIGFEHATGEGAEWEKGSALIALKALAETQGDIEKTVVLCPG